MQRNGSQAGSHSAGPGRGRVVPHREALGAGENLAGVFRHLTLDTVPEDAPALLRDFLTAAEQMPQIDGAPADAERLRRGEEVFMSHAACSTMVLLMKSVPSGYAAPHLAKILLISFNKSWTSYPTPRVPNSPK